MSSNHDSEHQLNLEIAGISLSIQSFIHWDEKPEFLPFIKKAELPDFIIRFQQTDRLPMLPSEVLYEDACYRVHPDGQGGYIRSFFDAPRDMTPYAVTEEDYANGRIQISYLPKGAHCVSQVHNSFFHIGFEKILMYKKRLCLHASCVDTQYGGLLFSGPSGIGKSTQSELWCRYRGAQLINGDRPILSKDESGWRAWGSPYAGSSRCHINKSCPVRAIIMLEKAANCCITRLSMPDAFRAVWSGLTVYGWDKWFVEEAVNLAMELIESVPVYRFSCTPDKRSVEVLESEIKGGCRK